MAIEKLISSVNVTSSPVGKSERDQGQPLPKKLSLTKGRNSTNMTIRIFSRRMKESSKGKKIRKLDSLP